jgi:hypothetical protein
MGRVTEIRTSGDNDPPSHPVRYEMHYLYCDECGSFDLNRWMEPENHEVLQDRVKLLGRVAAILAGLTGFLTILVFLDAIPYIIVGAIVVIGILIVRSRIKAKIKEKGLYCNNCQTQYPYGTSFFSSEENPKAYSMKDIPRPLNSNYQIVGRMLGPVEEQQ